MCVPCVCVCVVCVYVHVCVCGVCVHVCVSVCDVCVCLCVCVYVHEKCARRIGCHIKGMCSAECFMFMKL